MTGRERFLTALEGGKPDRLPCQVHNWMRYYLATYLDGRDQYEAYARFGMDPVIYQRPRYVYAEADRANWQVRHQSLGEVDGKKCWREETVTPGGVLTRAGESNEFTGWETEHLIKGRRDFELWERWYPLPIEVDWTPVLEAKGRIGETGIVRSGFFGFGQGSPWQDFCHMFGTEPAIMATFDDPEWVEHVMDVLLEKKLRVIELAGRFEQDLVETGGGAGSSTVISPDLHERFCLPYDRRQIEALHAGGTKVVYHLCGGVMAMLDLVAANGADAFETMTPPEMGGDCDLAEAERRVGDRLAFVGGFDQNNGFEKGIPEAVRKMVRELFEACPDGGYICAPSDHFFFGDPENIQAFADEAKACRY
jgi:uroporphyrinogen-III decarboxylase